jgi:hypothetical protein
MRGNSTYKNRGHNDAAINQLADKIHLAQVITIVGSHCLHHCGVIVR